MLYSTHVPINISYIVTITDYIMESVLVDLTRSGCGFLFCTREFTPCAQQEPLKLLISNTVHRHRVMLMLTSN